MKKLIPTILLVLMLVLPASADVMPGTVVHLELPYGQTAQALHMDNQPVTVEHAGHTWLLEDRYASFAENFMLLGGKTHAVYEYTVPEDKHQGGSFDTAPVIGTFFIAGHEKLQLQIFYGNRVNGQYVLQEQLELADPYAETISIPQDQDGRLQVIDRLYLYSYESAGKTQYYAASLYVEYENYIAAHAEAPTVSVPESVPEFTAVQMTADITPAPDTMSGWICEEPTCGTAWPDDQLICDECGRYAPLHGAKVRLAGVDFLRIKWYGYPQPVTIYVSPAGEEAWNNVANDVTVTEYEITGLQSNTSYDILLMWGDDRTMQFTGATKGSTVRAVPPATAASASTAAPMPVQATAAPASTVSGGGRTVTSADGKHRYQLFAIQGLSWDQADTSCKEMGGHLATITSEAEQYLIAQLNPSAVHYWIGGYQKEDGSWHWVTGEAWSYQNWGIGEPSGGNEHYASLWPVKWNDLYAHDTFGQNGFICEWDLSDE